MPRFDEPLLTRSGSEVCADLGLELPVQAELPPMIEPDPMPAVSHPVDEALVAVRAPGVLVLENYRRAGWANAHSGTWLRSSVLERLSSAASALPERWGICVFDAWRPLPLQAELYDAAYADPGLPPGFVSEPESDPTRPPPHLTGGTVDCSLMVDGIALGLGAGFDDFTSRAHVDALEATAGTDRELRRWLYWTMREAGFVVLDCEWWHFEFGTRRWGGITDAESIYGPAAPPILPPQPQPTRVT